MTTLARRALIGVAFVLATVSSGASAQMPPDAQGGKDHPLVQRFTGSALAGYRFSDWNQTVMPTGMKIDYRTLLESVQLEGKDARLIYLSPPGKSPLEVFRNYEQALTRAGLKKRFSCETNCSSLYFAWRESAKIDQSIVWSSGSIVTPSGSRYSMTSALSGEEGRFLYGTLPTNTGEVHVLVYTSMAANHTTLMATTYLEIVEPKAMETGQVTVDAKAMEAGLQREGKIALYGVFFDTGKAEIKPDSKTQLDEMTKLLKAQPALKVYIVGHTDNQGSFEGNVTLSQQRAQAVANALSAAPYQIDAKRLIARGVANLAPVASNTTEEGRAKNRRVELVAQ